MIRNSLKTFSPKLKKEKHISESFTFLTKSLTFHSHTTGEKDQCKACDIAPPSQSAAEGRKQRRSFFKKKTNRKDIPQ
jgi:hypothetical protein